MTGASWAPASTIVRRAQDSDIWALTWADDDALYGVYGDGRGFDPPVPTKLSLGLSRVTGLASSFTGINLRSPTVEQTGNGSAGKKGSGLLMVDGTLYMWVRNVASGRESALAWSADRGATWTWGAWRIAELGYPTFVNFGADYAGARDGFVYTVSHDNPSAYEPADRFVLLRAPRQSLRERSAWEFMERLDATGNPIWSSDIARRGAVFEHPGRCRRSAMTYSPGLGRYLWWQMLHEDGLDHRMEGGFGVYDAPEPWGPWTTVYFTPRWDVGPGETASFPPKWMSADGRTAYLVFSGDDAFSVRQVTFTVAAPADGGGPDATPGADATPGPEAGSEGGAATMESGADGAAHGADGSPAGDSNAIADAPAPDGNGPDVVAKGGPDGAGGCVCRGVPAPPGSWPVILLAAVALAALRATPCRSPRRPGQKLVPRAVAASVGGRPCGLVLWRWRRRARTGKRRAVRRAFAMDMNYSNYAAAGVKQILYIDRVYRRAL